ncbi:hypothetical protein GCM10022215_24050 [Nocardioides fonticola]|uniref:NlpC/P60 domain-containing protein n=1 Tax=Nocardioides fonticola TaxID=450363 RepID=A0ABP7XJY0_9ACTN
MPEHDQPADTGLITEADYEAAHAATPTNYDDILVAITARSSQDDLGEDGAGVTPATPGQALANARALSVGDVFVDVGKCLATVRGREFLIPAMWPDAETAWEQADGKHPTTDPTAIPRGAVVYWVNGRYGHVALSAGGGMCWSTDYRRPGYVDLAPIAALGPWCRGHLVGWAEELNGIDVWPHTTRPPKQVFGLDDRIRVVRAALRDAKAADAPGWRIAGLEAWLERLHKRYAAQQAQHGKAGR